MEKLRRFVSNPLSSSKRSDHPRHEAPDTTDTFMLPTRDEQEVQHHLQLHMDEEMLHEIVASVEEDYYSMSFDSGRHEIENYAGPNCRELDRLRLRITGLEKQHRAVCHRVADLVLEKHPMYEAELNGVLSLQADNLQTLELCKTIRHSLKTSADALVNSRITVLRNFRRRMRFQRTLHVLSQIQTLQHNIQQLHTFLSDGNFHAAIELHRESLVVLEAYRQYRCVEPIRLKLKALALRIDDRLDNELEHSCENFNEGSYSTIQQAFELLGSTQTTFAQLQMHYVAAIHRRSMCVVHSHVKLSERGENDPNILSVDSTYVELCSHLPASYLPTCLSELCQSVWVILLCYYRTIQWHRNRADSQQHSNMSGTSSHHQPESTSYQTNPISATSVKTLIQDVNEIDQISGSTQLMRQWHHYVATKLWSSRDHIWTEVSTRVIPILRVMDNLTTELTFDQVSTILRVIDHFIKIGTEFCGSPSTELVEVLRNSIHNFFKEFHCHHLERLCMFLEYETWEMCPVKPTFSIWDLQEFRTVSGMFQRTYDEISVNNSKADSQISDRVPSKSFFQSPYQFEQFPLNSDDLSKSINEHELDELEEQTVGNNNFLDLHRVQLSTVTLATNKKSVRPLFSNTTLEVLRLIGRYVQMIRLLRPIAAEVMHCICQVFDYYMYCLLDSADLPDRLCVTLKRINERLIASPDHPAVIKGDRVALPTHEPMHVFNSVKRFWDFEATRKTARSPLLWQAYLQAHFVGVESVVCLAEVLEHVLLPHLSTYLPERRRGLTSVFREQSITAARQLREACAIQIAPQLIYLLMPTIVENPMESQSTTNAIAASFSKIWPIGISSGDKDGASSSVAQNGSPSDSHSLNTISKESNVLLPYVNKISWYGKEAATSPSSYVNTIHQHILIPLTKCLKQPLGVDESSKTILWHAVLTSLGNMLLNAFSQIHSCSEEGRNQMLLDVQSIAVLAETDGKSRQFPHLDHLIEYIQAFYLPQHEWEHWLAQTGCCKYSRTQLTGLAHCLARNDRRQRQRLINAVNNQLSMANNGTNHQPTSTNGVVGS